MASDQTCSKHRLQHFRITHIGMDSSNGRSASAPALDTVCLLLCSSLSSFYQVSRMLSFRSKHVWLLTKHVANIGRNISETLTCAHHNVCSIASMIMLYSTLSFSSEINRKQKQNNSYSNCSIANAKY